MLVIEADTVSVDDSHTGMIVVEFVENDLATRVVRHYLLLERTHEFADQDAELGMADVYIELDSQTRACFGGIRHIALRRDRVDISLDETAARHLGDVDTIEVQFDAGTSQFEELRTGLRQVFKEFACYEDLSAGVRA